MLKLPASVSCSVYPVFSLLLAGGLLLTRSLPGQATTWTGISDDDWTKIPESASAEPQAYVIAKPANFAVVNAAREQTLAGRSAADAQASSLLPLWFYNVISSRDQSGYFGIMVGNDPFN